MARPVRCPKCGHEGEDFTRRSMATRECSACREVIPVFAEERVFGMSLLDIPLWNVGELLTVLGIIQGLALSLIIVIRQNSNHPLSFWWMAWCIVGILVSACQILGCVQIMRRRLHWWAVAGAVAALLPFWFTWALSAPLGVWALCTLCLRDVREDFL